VPEVSKTADQALVILKLLADRESLSIADVAREMGQSRTVVYRLLTTLEVHGFVRRAQGLYRLGSTLFALAQHVERAVRDAARLPMATLAESVQETVVLTVRDGLEAVSAERIVGRGHILQVNYPPGLRHPLSLTASGRAILAFASDEDRREAAQAADLSRPILETELAKIRRQGLAFSSSEYQTGLSGIAAPIRASGGVIASIAVVTPLGRADAMKRAEGQIVAAATEVSARLVDD
jgi:IclR family acetate operon transcriptional repressor